MEIYGKSKTIENGEQKFGNSNEGEKRGINWKDREGEWKRRWRYIDGELDDREDRGGADVNLIIPDNDDDKTETWEYSRIY